MVTSIYDKSDLKAQKLVEDQVYEGVHVKVLNIVISNKQPLWRRLWTFVQYSVLSTWYAVTFPADVVIASSGPITVGLPGLAARWLRGRKLVFEVRDLWPEGIVQLGILKNNWAQKLAYAFERLCYRSATKIVTLSPGMATWIEGRYGFIHTVSIPNACDNDLFGVPQPLEGLPAWAQQGNYALYTGNIGAVNNSELLLRAAARLKALNLNHLHMVLIGDGQLRKALEERAAAEALDNFHLLPLMPKKDLVVWVQHALCNLAPLKGVPILDTSSPNKLFDSLAAGVPIIQTTQGWIKTFLDKEQCGFTIAADDEQALIECLCRLHDHPEERTAMGQRARNLANTVFDREVLAKEMLDALA